MIAEGIVVAWIHYMSVMLVLGALLGEHLLLKPQLTLAGAKTLQRLDLLYGISATVLLITGIMRMYLEKGVDYYLHHGAFHILITLFVLIGAISIYPTIVFRRWSADTRAGNAPQLEPSMYRRLQMMLRAELTLLLIAPLFAAWMAHALL